MSNSISRKPKRLENDNAKGAAPWRHRVVRSHPTASKVRSPWNDPGRQRRPFGSTHGGRPRKACSQLAGSRSRAAQAMRNGCWPTPRASGLNCLPIRSSPKIRGGSTAGSKFSRAIIEGGFLIRWRPPMNVRALFSCLIWFAMGALGFSSFTSCRANGGSLISCGLVGFLIGAFKAALFASAWLIAVLFDGVAHLFGAA